jgi:hypothetical protein
MWILVVERLSVDDLMSVTAHAADGKRWGKRESWMSGWKGRERKGRCHGMPWMKWSEGQETINGRRDIKDGKQDKISSQWKLAMPVPSLISGRRQKMFLDSWTLRRGRPVPPSKWDYLSIEDGTVNLHKFVSEVNKEEESQMTWERLHYQ